MGELVVLSRRALIGACVAASIPIEANAQRDPCAEFYGRGYCTDYVNRRLGINQSGDARFWPSNIQRIDVRPNDVAIFRAINHVAVVEEIVEYGERVPYARNRWPARLRISEQNYGQGLRPGTPRSCMVTSRFGQTTYRTGTFDEAEFMRPRRR